MTTFWIKNQKLHFFAIPFQTVVPIYILCFQIPLNITRSTSSMPIRFPWSIYTDGSHYLNYEHYTRINRHCCCSFTFHSHFALPPPVGVSLTGVLLPCTHPLFKPGQLVINNVPAWSSLLRHTHLVTLVSLSDCVRRRHSGDCNLKRSREWQLASTKASYLVLKKWKIES